jgi:hypothetical protein
MRQIVANNIQKLVNKQKTKCKTKNNQIEIRITRTTPCKQYKGENKSKPVNRNQS